MQRSKFNGGQNIELNCQITAAGDGVSGEAANTYCQVQRLSDGYFYNWTTGEFCEEEGGWSEGEEFNYSATMTERATGSDHGEVGYYYKTFYLPNTGESYLIRYINTTYSLDETEIIEANGGFNSVQYDQLVTVRTEPISALAIRVEDIFSRIEGVSVMAETKLTSLEDAVADLAAHTVYVSSAGSDEAGTGTPSNPYLTLKKAYDNSFPGSIIRFATGDTDIYTGDTLTIKDRTIIGGGNYSFIRVTAGKTLSTGYGVSFINLGISANGANLYLNTGGYYENCLMGYAKRLGGYFVNCILYQMTDDGAANGYFTNCKMGLIGADSGPWSLYGCFYEECMFLGNITILTEAAIQVRACTVNGNLAIPNAPSGYVEGTQATGTITLNSGVKSINNEQWAKAQVQKNNQKKLMENLSPHKKGLIR